LRSGFVYFPRSSSSSSSAFLGPHFLPEFSKSDNKVLGPCSMHRKGKSRCVTCKAMKFSQKIFRSNVTHKTYNVIFANEHVIDCGSENIIYLITCTRCGIQYVGETVNALRFRMNAHRQSIKDKKDTLVATH